MTGIYNVFSDARKRAYDGRKFGRRARNSMAQLERIREFDNSTKPLRQ